MQFVWKFAAILLMSFGLALIVPEFPATVSGEGERPVVEIEVDGTPVTEADARERFGVGLVHLSYDDLAEVPEMREAILGVMGRGGWGCVAEGEWRSFTEGRSISRPENLVFTFRDGLYRVRAIETAADGSGDVCFEAELLGAYDNLEWDPFLRPDLAAVEAQPEVAAELRRLANEPDGTIGGRELTPAQWRRFRSEALENSGFGAGFVVFDRLFRGSVHLETADWTSEVPWLEPVATAIGAVLLLGGAALLVFGWRSNSVRPGTAIAPPILGAAFDLLVLAWSCFFAVVFLDTLWVGPLGQPTLVGLTPEYVGGTPITGLHFVSAPALFLAAPFLTLFVASTTGQRIAVDGEGVRSYGALGCTALRWEDLKTVSLREQKSSLMRATGDYRSLQRVVDLVSEERTITINRPSSRARRAAILGALRTHIPGDMEHLLEGIFEGW